MADILDYLKWRGDIAFDTIPLNELDALIFSEICYVSHENVLSKLPETEGITIKALYEKYSRKAYRAIGAIIPGDKINQLFKEISRSNRFKDVVVHNYVNDVNVAEQKQFCAMSFDIGNEHTFVAFSGTDDTIIGWKESLNMAVFTPIPSQRESVKYLEAIAEGSTRKIYIGGHSKGGNLAEYSAIMANDEIKERIVAVYSFDGPGFQKSFIQDKDYSVIKNKIVKVLPQSALVGAIFEPAGRLKFVKSNAKGLYQHDGFSWEVLGASFVESGGPDAQSADFHEFLRDWFANIQDSEKTEFIEALYKILKVNDAETLTDIFSNKFNFAIGVMKSDEESKKIFFKVFKKFIKGRYFSQK